MSAPNALEKPLISSSGTVYSLKGMCRLLSAISVNQQKHIDNRPRECKSSKLKDPMSDEKR